MSEVASKSDGKKKIRPVEPEASDSDDCTPLPKKSKPTVAAAKKTKEGKKEKAFKGVTAYNVYFGERTTALRQESPEMDRSEVAKLTGSEWKALKDAQETTPWVEKAAERNIVKRAAYEAAKANGSVSALESCVANHSDDTDDNDEDDE